MVDETEQLIVQLEAKVDQFEKQMKKAGQIADQGFGSIEARAKQSADLISSNLEKAASGIGGVFSRISGSFLGAAGIGGLGLGALLTTAVNLNAELGKIPGLARLAEVSTDKFQEIKFAANLGGVDDASFTAGLKSSLALLDEAQRQTNTLSRLFNANGLSIKDGNGQLIKFDALLSNAAGLIANARSEQERIKIAEMVGLTSDWVAVLRGGPKAFQDAAAGARDAGAVIDKEVLEKAHEFDKAWEQAIVKFKAGFTGALADIAEGFADFWESVVTSVPGVNFIRNQLYRWAGDLRGLSLPELQKALQDNVEAGLQVNVPRIQAEIDKRLGVTPLKVTVNAEVGSTPDKPTVVPTETEHTPFDRAVAETQKRIAATDAETASIGRNSEVRERAKTVAELEEAAKRSNTDAGFQNASVTDAQREKIDRLADALQNAGQKQREATTQFQGWNSALELGGGIAVDFFSKIGDKATTFQSLMQNVLKTLEQALLKALILGQGPLAGLSGTANPAGGAGGLVGAFGKLFGGDSDAADDAAEDAAEDAGSLHTGGMVGGGMSRRAVNPLAFAGAQRFHSGGLIGSEIPIIAQKGESILTPGQMSKLAPAAPAGGGGGNNVQVSITNNSGGEVQSSSRKENGVDIHEIIIGKVGDAMAGGRFDGPMRARFGNRVMPRSR